MDQQRPFLYLTLFFLGFLIWSTWQQEHAPKPAPETTQQAQNSQSQQGQIAQNNSQAPNIPSGSNFSINTAEQNKAQAQQASGKKIHVKTDVLDLMIDLQGGTISQVDLPTYPVSLEEKDKAIRILDMQKSYSAQSGFRHQDDANGAYRGDLAPSHYTNYSTEKSEYVLAEGQNQIIVPLVWDNGKGVKVTKNYIFERGNFSVKLNNIVDNQSENPWIGTYYMQLTHGRDTESRSMLTGGAITYTGPAYYHDKYIKVSFGDVEDEDLSDTVKGGWVAMLQHYFVSAWIPTENTENTVYTRFVKETSNFVIGTRTPYTTINSGAKNSFDSQFYVGPTDQEKLAKLSTGLDLTVDYGIFAFVSKPIFSAMNFIHGYVDNWGWTIILLTILIKIIFFYPSAISYKSMAKMKKLGPKIKEIADKYKNDPQGKQKATMAFYRKEKINPLGGCLPMLIQMPVFMGLYWVLQESVELRQAPWMFWYEDLSLKDPLFILPLLYGASMFIQQKLNPPVSQDPMQQKIFMYLPVVFTFMFLWFPSGLVLYWVVNNILTIAQQWFINKKILGDDALNH